MITKVISAYDTRIAADRPRQCDPFRVRGAALDPSGSASHADPRIHISRRAAHGEGRLQVWRRVHWPELLRRRATGVLPLQYPSQAVSKPLFRIFPSARSEDLRGIYCVIWFPLSASRVTLKKSVSLKAVVFL